MFRDFYRDFDLQKAEEMLFRLDIHRLDRLRTMSKGTREKVQLILVMSRKAELYLLFSISSKGDFCPFSGRFGLKTAPF